MAAHSDAAETRRPKQQAARPRPARQEGRSSRRNGRNPSVSDLQQAIRELEQRLEELTDAKGIRRTVNTASDQVGEVVTHASQLVGDALAGTLTDVAERVRAGALTVTTAARVGATAMEKIAGEMQRRPFLTVAMAVGIGFLAGMAARKELAG